MKQITYMKRSAEAQELSNQLFKLVQNRAVSKYACQEQSEINAFATGYLTSMVARLAAHSPAALRELQSSINYLEKQ